MARRFIRLDFLIPKKSKKTRRRYLTNRRRTTTGAAAPKFFVKQKISGGFLVFSQKRFFLEFFAGVFHVEHTSHWLPQIF
jgi:hypothetical protein